MRLHEEANAFTPGGERVYTSRGTRLREEANAFALYLASERYCSMLRSEREGEGEGEASRRGVRNREEVAASRRGRENRQ